MSKLHCIQIQEKRIWIWQILSIPNFVPSCPLLSFIQKDIFLHSSLFHSLRVRNHSWFFHSLIYLFILTIHLQLVALPYTIFLLLFFYVTSNILIKCLSLTRTLWFKFPKYTTFFMYFMTQDVFNYIVYILPKWIMFLTFPENVYDFASLSSRFVCIIFNLGLMKKWVRFSKQIPAIFSNLWLCAALHTYSATPRQ